ncbi:MULTISPECIES: capsule biosynthesis protein [unclassified Ruegeria]|uniref:capsule biosynthesis protein n=1 Tax=unclassified Ruegeria TaxID=2625375 RepID=UPI001487FFF5|nr:MULTISPECIES: capsular biosynthesis protein [unclassified Ruegeria]NOD74992.1 capsule biosynthesis protein CapA [Ruegeria sp. HKCCD4332]NOD86953.1 capsule biosynthesis protein CapA [Ruegeria sp. HKCCD4318]NOE12508.1 capsule biosynthesis protein CapA [Ruegeria sp. HKCCD4318-2]NOG09327.1 capsular biosynthesis protein [Ruegeria sp. HKCCD4315]
MQHTPLDPKDRVFLFLQGPHGPFFSALGKMLRAAGAQVWRVGFNAGDQAFWFEKASFLPFLERQENWPDTLCRIMEDKGVTDIVLYGDTRPVHAQAVQIAKARGVIVHVFEEGYLRPWWITYERNGSNGNSRLMSLDAEQMQQALEVADSKSPPPPSHWGDMRQHIFYGALYHWFVMFRNGRYKNFRRHRELPVSQEFRLYFKRLILMPFHRLRRSVATAQVRRGGYPYHLVLLQLGHDSSVQAHSGYSGMCEFLDHVIEGFAQGAPAHHRLVIKEHPLENHREPLRRHAMESARRNGIRDRIHYVPGGKLAKLLDDANSAVTVNSTAGQQVLWRGIPLRTFGRSVYEKPEFVSQQPIAAFFAAPKHPDSDAYRCYRQFLLETSQVPGGFYSRRGRRQALRRAADMMLTATDPYQSILNKNAARTPQLKIVEGHGHSVTGS